MQKDLRAFMDFKPNVYRQTYFDFVDVENVTFAGYNAKIRMLNASYGMNESVYANPKNPVYAKVTGRPPSKTVSGATGGFSFTVNLLIGGGGFGIQ